MTRKILWLALSASTFACAAGTAYDPPDRENTEQAKHRAATERYYVVMRPDLRKCAHPYCGGVFIAEVNNEESACYGNELAPDCYAASMDFSALGLDGATEQALREDATGGRVIVRGAIETLEGHAVGHLVAKAAWRGVTGNTPAPNFYQVKDNGIVCITYPCPSVSQVTLNTGEILDLGNVDLTTSGASDDDLALASNAIFGDGLVVSGIHDVVDGPGGQAAELEATEIYLPVGQDIGQVCGNTVCGAGTACCNASCNMCAPIGSACIQIACEPECGHDECAQGTALTDGCSDCATQVCQADAFCCTDSWDGLCVQQAQNLCDSCAPPPPPACAHDECETGGKLTASCSSCAAAVCAQDAFCCASEWDALCVEQAAQSCDACTPTAPTCAHDTCAEGVALDASCSTCAEAVCAADDFCCATLWDDICVAEAVDLCGDC